MLDRNSLYTSLDAIGSENELRQSLRNLAGQFGFSAYMLFGIPFLSDEALLSRIEMSDLPERLLDDYDRLGLLRNSPVFNALRRATVPVLWSLENSVDPRPAEQAGLSAELLRKHDLIRGAFFPVHSPRGERAALGFLGNRDELSLTELGDLGVFAAHAYNIHSALKDNHQLNEGLLTPRELEALHWAANGKTSGEIALILSLSEHTINTYMNNAMRKLDCVNRTQLVAKALRLRLIY